MTERRVTWGTKALHITLEREQEIRRIAALPAKGPNLAMVLLARDAVALIDEGWEIAQAVTKELREVEMARHFDRLHPFLSMADSLAAGAWKEAGETLGEPEEP